LIRFFAPLAPPTVGQIVVDNAGVKKVFFSGTRIQSNFICSIGYGDPASVFPRNPRLSFEEAGRWV
jgi:3-hydroxypropanoate dehydrogenase